MAVEKGSAFLLKIGDGGAPVTYATVARMRTTQVSVNGEAVNITSKDSGGWPDGTDAPLGEELEAYRVQVMANDAVLREWETLAPAATYLAADRAADALAADPWPLRIHIRQRGTLGMSQALMLALS